LSFLALKHLSQSDHRANGIFKGGTSLSKAYGAINRFSEDIDMAILNDNGSDIGNRRRMERVERALTSNECFTEDPDHLRVKKGSWLRQNGSQLSFTIRGSGFRSGIKAYFRRC